MKQSYAVWFGRNPNQRVGIATENSWENRLNKSQALRLAEKMRRKYGYASIYKW